MQDTAHQPFSQTPLQESPFAWLELSDPPPILLCEACLVLSLDRQLSRFLRELSLFPRLGSAQTLRSNSSASSKVFSEALSLASSTAPSWARGGLKRRKLSRMVSILTCLDGRNHELHVVVLRHSAWCRQRYFLLPEICLHLLSIRHHGLRLHPRLLSFRFKL